MPRQRLLAGRHCALCAEHVVPVWQARRSSAGRRIGKDMPPAKCIWRTNARLSGIGLASPGKPVMISVVMATSGMAKRAAATSRQTNRGGLAACGAGCRTAGLQRQVQMRHKRESCQSWKKPGCNPMVQRRETQRGTTVSFRMASTRCTDAAQAKGPDPGAEVYAGQHDLPGITAVRMSAAPQDRPAATRTARQSSNTESAAVIAAILRFDKGAGTQTRPGPAVC